MFSYFGERNKTKSPAILIQGSSGSRTELSEGEVRQFVWRSTVILFLFQEG